MTDRAPGSTSKPGQADAIALHPAMQRAGKQANTRLDSTETVTLLGGAEKLLQRASGGMVEAGRERGGVR